ncbi:hypothetical protein BJ742DRAFT_295161 [Cladochytrium replicatum]|nr:hypothetical protein BJ742DRAFT_295161 [Cladochytrium replicatum]
MSNAFAALLVFISLVAFHHIAMRLFRSRMKGRAGESGGWPQKIYLPPEAKERVNAKPHPGTTEDFLGEDYIYLHVRFQEVHGAEEDGLPVVVCESHLGMAVQVWGYMERALENVLPILTYERQGYGLSSSPLNREEQRTVEDLARDLYLLLDQLNLLADGKLRKGRPLILVGHSFGGLILRAFQVPPHKNPSLVPSIF